MIDIALAAASAGTPEEIKPLPPKPVQPEPKSKPVEKPKPKPKPVKVKSEVKKPIVKPQLEQAKSEPMASPVKDINRNLPVVGNKANAQTKQSQSGKVTVASWLCWLFKQS
jgi:hypothetical protein